MWVTTTFKTDTQHESESAELIFGKSVSLLCVAKHLELENYITTDPCSKSENHVLLFIMIDLLLCSRKDYLFTKNSG